MTAIKKIFLFLLTAMLCMPAGAQDSTAFKLLRAGQLKSFGRSAMVQGDYNSAAIYLSRYMQQRPDNARGAYWLAESYRMTRDYAQAMHWYETAYKLSDNTLAEALYYQAVLLKMHGDCETAREKFTAFRKLSGGDKSLTDMRRQMRYELAGCDSLVGQPGPARLVVNRLDTTINKPHIESAPVYLHDSLILYSSLRVEEPVYRVEGDTTTPPARTFYQATRNGELWKFAGEHQNNFGVFGENLSSVTFSPDSTKAYISRCAPDWRNKMICQLYVSEKKNGNWTAPVNLGKSINLKGTSNTQPTAGVTSKGVEIIYFVSDRKGGKGGTDIWYFTWNVRRKIYTSPRNAGSKINTRQDELSPWYDQEYRTLYFSSSGHPGIGGLDIFRSIGEVRRFTIPENLKEPVNSGYDDLHYVLAPDRAHGMFTSNRKGGNNFKNESCCDDLYEFRKTELVKIILAGHLFGVDSVERLQVKQPLLELQLVDKLTGEAVLMREVEVAEDGSFSVSVESGNIYKITGGGEGYLKKSVTLNTEQITTSTEIIRDIYLPKRSLEGYRLENVYYETDKHELTPTSRTVLDTTLLVLLQENPDIKIEISAHTDDVGTDSYNMSLSQRRAEGVVSYLISKGIDRRRLVAKGYGETKPLAPNLNPDGTPNIPNRDRNRRTEFRVIGTVPVKVVDDNDP